MRLYHGTTREAYEQIKNNGFGNGDYKPVWNCSDPDVTYFWSTDKLIELGEFDADLDEESLEYNVITKAFEQAQIAAAKHSNATDMIVLCVEVDADYAQDDNSCPNMDGAMYVTHDDLNKHGKITSVYSAPFSPRLSLLILADLVNYHYMDLDLLPVELKMIEAINKSGVFCDELLEFDFCQIA